MSHSHELRSDPPSHNHIRDRKSRFASIGSIANKTFDPSTLITKLTEASANTLPVEHTPHTTSPVVDTMGATYSYTNEAPYGPDHGWIATPHLHNEAHARLTGQPMCIDYEPTNGSLFVNALEALPSDRNDGAWNGRNSGPTLLDAVALGSTVDDAADLIYMAGRAARERRRQRSPTPFLGAHVECCDAKVEVVVVLEEAACTGECKPPFPEAGSARRMKKALKGLRRKLGCFTGQK